MRSKEQNMKTNKKILLSTVATLTLLLNGCGDGTTGAAETADAAASTVASTAKETISNANNGDNLETTPAQNPEVTPEEPNEPLSSNPFTAMQQIDARYQNDNALANASVTKLAGWYVRTKISATDSNGQVYSHSTAGVFGELTQSDLGKDQHDIPNYGPAILQVVFPQTEWDDNNGDYFSDYRHFDISEFVSAKRVWTFQIKNQHTIDLSNAAISIDTDDALNVILSTEENGNVTYEELMQLNIANQERLKLADVDNHQVYTLAELKNADLGMQGMHTRTFRWVFGTVDESDFDSVAEPAAVSTMSVLGADQTNGDFAVKTKSSTGGKFGLPPQ